MDKLTLHRKLNSTTERLWAALTDPDQMRKWYFPMMPHFSPQIGFRTEFDVHHNGKVFPHVWTVTDAIEPRVIAYNWQYRGYEGDSQVRFVIENEGENSNLILECEVIEEYDTIQHPELSSENFTAGWNHLLDSLETFLSTNK